MHPETGNNESVIDFITGESKADAGSEANRQMVERLLVENKGYRRRDIEVDAAIVLDMEGGRYRSTIDLIIRVNGMRFMVLKCAAGALASREREMIAAARLMENYQIPLAGASDGRSAVVWDTVSGQCIGEGLDAIPTKARAVEIFDAMALVPLEKRRLARQQLIFKSYDSMNIHRATWQWEK